MKSALLAAAVAATAVTFSTGAALADKSYTPNWKPHGVDTRPIYRPRQHYYHQHEYRPVYRPVYRPSPVAISREHVREQRRDAFADGRITWIEKLKLNAAQRRHERLERSYR